MEEAYTFRQPVYRLTGKSLAVSRLAKAEVAQLREKTRTVRDKYREEDLV